MNKNLKNTKVIKQNTFKERNRNCKAIFFLITNLILDLSLFKINKTKPDITQLTKHNLYFSYECPCFCFWVSVYIHIIATHGGYSSIIGMMIFINNGIINCFSRLQN